MINNKDKMSLSNTISFLINTTFRNDDKNMTRHSDAPLYIYIYVYVCVYSTMALTKVLVMNTYKNMI